MGGGPVGVKCCAANSSLPPRRADPHAEGKTLWDKTPPRSAVFRVDPPLPSLPRSFSHPPPRSPSVTREGNRHSGWGGRGPPERGLWGLVESIRPPEGPSRVDLWSISCRSWVDLGSISGRSRVIFVLLASRYGIVGYFGLSQGSSCPRRIQP